MISPPLKRGAWHVVSDGADVGFLPETAPLIRGCATMYADVGMAENDDLNFGMDNG